MKGSFFPIRFKRKPTAANPDVLYGTMLTDGKGDLYDLRPNGSVNTGPLFLVGDVLEIEESFVTVSFIELIPPIKDCVIESIWQDELAYSPSGFFGFRYFIGVKIYDVKV